MKAFITLGSTSQISMELCDLCYRSQLFDKYILYAKDLCKLKIQHSDGTDYKFISLDLKNEINAEQIIPKEFIRDVEEVTFLIAAFTIQPIKKIVDLDPKGISENIHINLVSQVQFVSTWMSYCRNKNMQVKIIYLNSGAAFKEISGWSLYCSAKSYMSMYLKCLQLESKVKVVLYDPGVVDTKMQEIIRSADAGDFSRVEEFIGYKQNNKLKSPLEVASEIYHRFMLNWDVNSVFEKSKK